MKKSLVALALTAALLPFSSAHAGTISYTAATDLKTTNWTDVLSFKKFDTSLGKLTSIKFDLSGLVEGAGQAESKDTAESSVILSLESALTLRRPDGSKLVVTNPLFEKIFSFTAFDGVEDYSGTSGGSTGTVSAEATESFISTIAADFALFSALGGGDIVLGLGAVGKSSGSGSGNLVTQFNTAASGRAVVTYTYTPTVDVPEPATIATFMLGLGLVGAARRRRANKQA